MAKGDTAKSKAKQDGDAIKPVRANRAKRIEQPSPSFMSLYSNDIQIQLTPWDIRLRLGQIESVDAEKGEAIITILADVRLSPQHAKKLWEVLGKQVAAYETSVGPIPQPPE